MFQSLNNERLSYSPKIRLRVKENPHYILIFICLSQEINIQADFTLLLKQGRNLSSFNVA